MMGVTGFPVFALLLAFSVGEKRVMEDFRVPTAVVPSHYTLKMLTNLEDDFSFHGEVWITVKSQTAVDTITLNYKNLEILENATKIEHPASRTKREVPNARKRLAFRGRGNPEENVKPEIMDSMPKTEKPENSEPVPTKEMVPSEVKPVEIPMKAIEEATLAPEKPAEAKPEVEMPKEPENAAKVPDPVSGDTLENPEKPVESVPEMEPVAKPEEMEKPAEEVKPVETEAVKPAVASAEVQPEKETSAEAKPLEEKPAEVAEAKPQDEKPVEVAETNPQEETPVEVVKPSPEVESPVAEKPTEPEKPSDVPVMEIATESFETEIPAEMTPAESETVKPVEVTESMAIDDDEPLEVVTHDFDTERQFVTLGLSRALKPGQEYVIYLKFQGFLSDNLAGFYRMAYSKKNRKTSTWAAATVFEPMDARSAFPCFDEPEYKATFDVILGHSSQYKALSNMPLRTTNVMTDKPGWQWDYFQTTPKMSTYLVSFFISDFEGLEDNSAPTRNRNATEFKLWARHDVLHKGRYAIKAAPKMMKYLQDQLQVADVMPKYDLLAMPSFISNALENWGIPSFSERSILYSPGLSAVLNKYETTRLIGHELSHSWFGNSLTPRWWDQIWLSEGMCNFFETKAADHIQPQWDVITFSTVSAYLRVFTLDGQQSTHALVPPVKNLNDVNDIFDSITYQKGYYLIRMLNHTLGEEAFMDGVRAYVKAHQLDTVEEGDLWRALTEHGHAKGTLPQDLDLTEVMRAWTREPGYPVVKVTRDYANRTATLTQMRFVRPKEDYELRSQNESGELKGWYIPITYTSGEEKKFRDSKPRVWMRPQQQQVVLDNVADEKDFVLLNIDAAGLYRVNYDYDNWALLVDALLSDNFTEISVINRVQIIDDLLDFARAGEIAYKIALDATSYLRREKHYLPWRAAFNNFEFISRMMRSTEGGKVFKKFMRNLVSARYEELGFQPKTNETLFESMNRKHIVKWACRTGHKQCVRNSVGLFKKWTNEKKPDEVNPIPSNLRSVVYCTAIEQGGARDWQFLWQRYLSIVVVTDKPAIIAGLGCSRNTRTLKKYLDWSLKETSGVKKQDSVAVFKAVAGNDVGYPIAKKFLKDRISEVPKYVGVGSNGRHVPQMIDSLARKMNKLQDITELEELEKENSSALRTSPRVIQQAMEKVRFNVGWVQTNMQPITDWLKRQTAQL